MISSTDPYLSDISENAPSFPPPPPPLLFKCVNRTPGYGAYSAFSPITELSVNLAELSAASNNNRTPRRKLSLCSSISSTPGASSASSSSARHDISSAEGIRFNALNFSAEDSPFMQFRSSAIHCLESQAENESSPVRIKRFMVARQTEGRNSTKLSQWKKPDLKMEEDQNMESTSSIEKLKMGIGSSIHCSLFPECSPIVSSSLETMDAPLAPMLHFDRSLVCSQFRPSTKNEFVDVSDDNKVVDTSNSFASPFLQISSANLLRSFSGHDVDDGSPCFQATTSTPLRSSKSWCAITPQDLEFPEGISPSTLFTPDSSQCLSKNESDPLQLEHIRRTLFHVEDPPSGSLPSDGCPPPAVSSRRRCLRPSLQPADNNEDVKNNSRSKTQTSSYEDDEDKEDEQKKKLDESENFMLDNDDEQSLIGDFSRPYCLPLIHGKHPDLRAISPETMADIIIGHYNKVLENFQIIDCRYPYEFHGGHLLGAKNIYSRDDLVKEFFSERDKLQSLKESEKRNVFIFHCEFSSERAPKLLRFLRNKDRDMNEERYPFLFYPEAYILEGGYKSFYENHRELCFPDNYVPMVHVDFAKQMKEYRLKERHSCEDRRAKQIVTSTENS